MQVIIQYSGIKIKHEQSSTYNAPFVQESTRGLAGNHILMEDVKLIPGTADDNIILNASDVITPPKRFVTTKVKVVRNDDDTANVFEIDNVKQKTIEPLIKKRVAKGSTTCTDEYNIYARLQEWGYKHQTVNHGKGEYARDEDGDGFHEVHVNTIEGVWSLLRSWLRPHRGVSQDKLPIYVKFFEFIHNCRKRGKSLISSLIQVLVVNNKHPHASG